jgi:peptidyl-prolyl cis-trans isomerase C
MKELAFSMELPTSLILSSARNGHARFGLVVLGCIAILLCACEAPSKHSSAELGEGARTESTRRAMYSDSRLTKADQSLVVAQVGKESFTLAEYERRLNSQAPFARSRYNSIARKKDFLENMVQFEVLADEAERLGYGHDPEVILSMKQAMVRKLITDKISKTISVEDIPDQEISDYYEKNKADYVRPEKVRTSQIVVDDEETAKKIAEELEVEFMDKPNKRRKIFAAKARKVSTDKATAELGGDMRFYARQSEGGTVPKVVTDLAFDIERVGNMSAPFDNDGRWTLLILTAKKAKFERSLEDVKRNIANRLYRERKTQAEREFVAKIKAAAKIEINEEILTKIPDVEPNSKKDKPGFTNPHGDAKSDKPQPDKKTPSIKPAQ